MDNQIAIDLIARNAVSPELAKLQQDVQATAKTVQESAKNISGSSAHLRTLAQDTDLTGRSLREVLVPLKLFTSHLATEFNPALGQMVFTMGAAGRAGTTMSLSLAASTAIIAVAATGLAAYAHHLDAVAKAQAEANFSFARFDATGLLTQIDAAIKGMDEFDLSWKNKIMNKIWPDPNVRAWADKLWGGAIFGKPDPAVLAAPTAKFLEMQPLEQQIKEAQQAVQLNQARVARAQVQASDAERQADLGDFIAAEKDLAAAINLEADALERVIRSEATLARGAAHYRGPEVEAKQLPEIAAIESARLRAAGVQREARLFAHAMALHAGQLAIQDVTERVDTTPYTGTEIAPEEGFALGQTAVRDLRREGTAQTAERQRAQVQLQQQALGLTSAQRLELTLIAIQQEKSLAYAQAEGKENQEHLTALAEMQAAMKTQIELQKEAAKENPFVGVKLGLQEVADAFTSYGDLMRQGVHTLGDDMARTFSSTFTSVVEGDFKKLADLPKAFALNVLTTISDVLGKAVIGNMLSPFLRAFGGSPGPAFFSVAGGGGGGGAGLMEIGGQLFQSVASGVGHPVWIPVSGVTSGVSGAGVSLGLGESLANAPALWEMAVGPAAAEAGLGFGAPALGGVSGAASLVMIGGRPMLLVPAGGGGTLGGTLTAAGWNPSAPLPGASWLSGTNVGAIWNAPIGTLFSSDVVFSGGQLISNAGELAMLGQESAGVAGESAALGGMSAGAALGGAAAVAALAFTVYQGLKGQPGGPTATSIATGAISGAVSGAMLGTLVYPGIGTAVGAIAGALLGGGAAAFGKDTTPRSVAETARATGAAQTMIDDIATATNPESLHAIVTSWSSGYVGGTHDVAIITRVRGVAGVGPGAGAAEAPFIGHPNPTYRVATVAEMMAHPQDIAAYVQAGVEPSGLSQANSAVAQAIRNKIAEFGQLAALAVSAEEDIGGGLLRRTTVPGSLAASRLAGRQLSIDSVAYAAAIRGMTDAQKAAFLQDLLRVDLDQSLGILVQDPATTQIVSLTTVPAAESVAGPGGDLLVTGTNLIGSPPPQFHTMA